MTAGQASEWTARLGRARKVIAAALPATPLIPAHGLGKGVLLKLESFQPTGSFKVRGALAALSAAKNGNGVVTASTGNYALGGAWAAHRLGVPATLVVPATAAAAKLAALQRYPATVIVHGDHYEDAEQHARSLATSSGLRYLSASSDPEVIAGQASIGFELLTQLQGSFTVVCGVGGGGLALGLGLAANRSGRMSISGVEAAASPAMSTAIRPGTWFQSKLARRPIWIGLSIATIVVWLVATILSLTLPVARDRLRPNAAAVWDDVRAGCGGDTGHLRQRRRLRLFPPTHRRAVTAAHADAMQPRAIWLASRLDPTPPARRRAHTGCL